jgi:hypothetical protein
MVSAPKTGKPMLMTSKNAINAVIRIIGLFMTCLLSV